jgi:DNA-binding MarR family transcriptional regulator
MLGMRGPLEVPSSTGKGGFRGSARDSSACRMVTTMERGEVPDAWSTFALQIFRINGLIIRAGENISGPLGQSSARWQVLGRVLQPQTVPDIARDIGLARQTVQRTADLLAAEGLVCFRAHPADRRTRLVELTPEGRRVLTALHESQVSWSVHLLERLDADVLRRTTDALDDIAAVLQQDLELSQGDLHRAEK